MLSKSGGFYDQLEDVDFFVDGGSGCSCGSYHKNVFEGSACCECEVPGSSSVKYNCDAMG